CVEHQDLSKRLICRALEVYGCGLEKHGTAAVSGQGGGLAKWRKPGNRRYGVYAADMADYIYLLENRLSAAQQAALLAVREVARAKGLTVFLVGGAVRDMTSWAP